VGYPGKQSPFRRSQQPGCAKELSHFILLCFLAKGVALLKPACFKLKGIDA
jgi:hypothetical protein